MTESNENFGILQVPLITIPEQNKRLRRLFSNHYSFYLTTNKLAKKQLQALRNDREYQHYRTKLKRWHIAKHKPSKDEKKFVNSKLKKLTAAYHIDSKFNFQNFVVNETKGKFPKTSSVLKQKISHDIYNGLDKVLYQGAKKLGFKKFQDFTLSTVVAKTPWRLEGRTLTLDLRKHFAVKLAPLTPYRKQVLDNAEIRYFRLVQIPKENHTDYAVQITYRGLPPLMNRTAPKRGRIGLDIGPSSLAIYAQNSHLAFENLFEKSDDFDNQITEIQQKMSLLDEWMNPDAFIVGPNGKTAYMKGHKLRHSQQWYHLRQKVRHLHYLKSVQRKQEFEIKTNELMAISGNIKMEKLSISGWQAGLFGHSINNHAPSQFMAILKRKLAYFGLEPLEINTNKAKLSQFHHDTGEFVKPTLQERDKIIHDFVVQRDLYSAFLAAFVEDDGHSLSPQLNKKFTQFKKFQNEWVKSSNGKFVLDSFGQNPKIKEQAGL